MKTRSIAHWIFTLIVLISQVLHWITFAEALGLHSLAYIGVNVSAIAENNRK